MLLKLQLFGRNGAALAPVYCCKMPHNIHWNDPRINAVYQEMAEHYGTAIIPARVRSPKDKPVMK